eukprot:3389918-Amphidinium_carterae.1
MGCEYVPSGGRVWYCGGSVERGWLTLDKWDVWKWHDGGRGGGAWDWAASRWSFGVTVGCSQVSSALLACGGVSWMGGRATSFRFWCGGF